ncbi:MAG: sulfur carrier protein ThiS [Thermodesulfobacteriota bacterium]
MKIICNGKEMAVRDSLTIEELVLELDLNPATVVVECNGSIVLPDKYADNKLSEGSVLELIRFVGGG